MLPVWAHLNVFALAVLLPLWALLGVAAWTWVERTRAGYEEQTLALARKLGADLDRELSGFGGVLRTLATSPALQGGNLAEFQQQAVQVAQEGTAIVLRDTTGHMLVSTLFPPGTKLPATSAGAVIEADRCVLRTHALCTSDLYVGTTDRQPYVLVDGPVLRDGKVVFVLNIAIRAHRLATLLSAGLVPQQWTASILDRQDRVIARWPEHERFVGQLATDPVRRNARGDEGRFRSETLDGIQVQAAYMRLPGWGWRVAVGVPQAVLEQPLRQSALYLGGVGVLAVGLSAVIALLYGRALAHSIATLSAMAARIGQEGALQPAATAIREANEVAAALAAASARLGASDERRDAAEAQLRRLNEELEERVEREIQAREAAQAKAAHAQRMQALGQLAGGIAHDFNNVLQATAGGAAMIQKRAAEPDAVRRFARMILDASERGSSVTRRLLAFSKHGVLRAEAVELPALFAGLEEMLSHTLGAHVAVRVELPARLPAVMADRGQLETVLVNLATNARDAMPEGGTLTLSAREQAAADPETAELVPGRYVRLAAADDGAGMDPATLARATEPFFTTKGRGEGTGLGLAMARGFAEQSGGRLAIESRPGIGTTVSLWLPAAEAAVAGAEKDGASGPGSSPLPSGSMARPVILLVEDETLVRDVLGAQLEEEGYEVRLAASGAEALALLDRVGHPDALVTDLNMPGMTGLDLIRAVRARGLSVATILLTGHAEDGPALALDGAVTPAFSLLRKPVLGPDLAAKLAALTAGARMSALGPGP